MWMRALVWAGMVGVACGAARGQFDLEESHTAASLRGVDALGAGVAWASGTGGTVLRTEDGGLLWQTCAMPKGAEKLDFRGVQAFDAKTAVVMSSGTGPLSKVYRTTDGCATWTLVFENPDQEGFFDAMHKVTERQMYLLGDPVDGKFALFFSGDAGQHWYVAGDPGLGAAKGAGAFAASNSSFAAAGISMFFGTGATASEGPKVYRSVAQCGEGAGAQCALAWQGVTVPLAGGSASAGVFSLAARASVDAAARLSTIAVAVGGDYTKPGDARSAAAYSLDGGAHWTAAAAGPGGFRSAVAYANASGRWIAVGPSGTDVSRDDGKTWTKVEGETAGGWNAISLPFAVGAKGKIGKLRDGVLTN